MSETELNEIWARWEQATPDEWTSDGARDSYCIRAADRMNPAVAQTIILLPEFTYGLDAARDNADFIANAHQDIPRLKAHIDELTSTG